MTARKTAEPNETQHRDGTKYAKASELWTAMLKKDPNTARKDLLEAAIEQADMTPASANTLYQQWRDEHGMVKHEE